MNETITPTYEEGVLRGRTEQSVIDTAGYTADIFKRDEYHAETMLNLARTIERGLGNVAACDREYEARNSARDLVIKLRALVEHFERENVEHRAEAKRLRGES